MASFAKQLEIRPDVVFAVVVPVVRRPLAPARVQEVLFAPLAEPDGVPDNRANGDEQRDAVRPGVVVRPAPLPVSATDADAHAALGPVLIDASPTFTVSPLIGSA